jgi:CheY-like chemotaxis protein
MASPLALVVEDDWALAGSFQIALQYAGFDVHLTDTARGALELVAALRPCLVVLDLYLADADDLPMTEVQPQLVQACRDLGARVVAITGDPRLAEYLQADFDLVLYKPVSPAQLGVLARRLCQWSEPADLSTALR